MGAHSHDTIMEETYKGGTTVAAAAGYLVLDERFASQSPQPVLAWRVGNELVLPITRAGVECRECWVAYPDGRVRHHGPPGHAATWGVDEAGAAAFQFPLIASSNQTTRTTLSL